MLKALALLVLLAGGPALAAGDVAPAQNSTPKFGPKATPVFAAEAYLRTAPAPDYWRLAPFYIAQRGSSDCSLAAAAMAMNALIGLPGAAETSLVTESSLLEAVDDAGWAADVAEDGPGVTFGAFTGYLQKSLTASGLSGATLEASQPGETAAGLASLRAALAANEAAADDVMLIYFNQGVVTGDWDGPHISPIGAYDAAADRVLIMDVDRDWYVPYWTDTATLLQSLVKPVPAEFGPLAGGRGGFYVLKRPPT